MNGLACSIDMEPRTLSQGELKNAREAAVDIVQKKEPDEASNIFTKGMKPVVSIKELEKQVQRTEKVYTLVEQESADSIKRAWDGCACACACPCNLGESPDKSKIAEPFSAPF